VGRTLTENRRRLRVKKDLQNILRKIKEGNNQEIEMICRHYLISPKDTNYLQGIFLVNAGTGEIVICSLKKENSWTIDKVMAGLESTSGRSLKNQDILARAQALSRS